MTPRGEAGAPSHSSQSEPERELPAAMAQRQRRPTARTSTTPRTSAIRRPDRSVGTKVKASIAAERALDTGEELEDTLWLGSGRFDGANVRRQLQRVGHSSRWGSQRFLQSMRFWESIRFKPRTRNTSVANSASTHSQAAPPRKPLEYNGGSPSTVIGTSSRLHSPKRLLLEQQKLLSMRCEASRSMRRQRNGLCLRDWFMEEPIPSAAAITKNNSPLQKKTLRLMEQLPNTDTNNTNDYLVCRGVPTQKTPAKKRWRLWLPHRKKPIDLLHPSTSFDNSTSSSYLQSETNTTLPAHVQLKQQLAKQQKQTVAERGSRNLELLQLNDSNQNHNDSPFPSFQTMRSSRLGVHSNQPLLQRRPRIVISNDSTDEEDTTNGSTRYLLSSVPKQVQMKSLLVQEISGLSIDSRTVDHNQPHHMVAASSYRNCGDTDLDDNDDDDDNNFYSVQELLDRDSHPPQGRVQLVNTAPLEPEGNRLHYWFEDEDEDEEEDGFSQQGIKYGLSTRANVSTDGSSRRTQSNSTNSTSYMQKQSGLIRLECVDEADEELTESEHINEDPRFGVDPKFGESTRTSNSTINGSISSRALSGSLTSTHASHDSSCSFHKQLQDTMSPASLEDSKSPLRNLPPNHPNYRNSFNGHTSQETHSSKGGANSNSKARRKTLPFGALGSKQQGVRGGVLSECAKKAGDDPSMSASMPIPRVASGSSTDLQERRRCSLSDAPASPVNEKKESFTPPSPLQEETNPLLLNRCSSLPDRWQCRQCHNITAGEHILNEQQVTLEAPQPPDAPGTKNEGVLGSNPIKEMSDPTSTHAGGDWCKDPPGAVASQDETDRGFEIVWNAGITGQTSSPEHSTATTAARTTAATKEDWWNVKQEEGGALQGTQSFVSNLYVVGDEVGGGDIIELQLNDRGDEEEFYDTRSVCSEPAHMGMCMADDDGNVANQWLLAWDDLALL